MFVDCVGVVVVAKEGDVDRYATWFPNVRRTGIVCEKYYQREKGKGRRNFNEYGKISLIFFCYFKATWNYNSRGVVKIYIRAIILGRALCHNTFFSFFV